MARAMATRSLPFATLAQRPCCRLSPVPSSFAIAGNHVLVVPVAGIDLSEILHSWKSFTANAINRALGRKGVLWQDESHDHLVRSEASLARITAYIHAHEDQGAYVEKRKL